MNQFENLKMKAQKAMNTKQDVDINLCVGPFSSPQIFKLNN